MAKYRPTKNYKSKDFQKKVLIGAFGFFAVVLFVLVGLKKIDWLKNKKGFENDNDKTAFQIAEHLGVIYPSWDPRHWSENDSDVVDLIDENRRQYKEIAAAYTRITKRRLSEDVVKYIDDYTLIADVI